MLINPKPKGDLLFFSFFFFSTWEKKEDSFSEGNVVVGETVEIKFPNFHSTRNPLRKDISSMEQQERF